MEFIIEVMTNDKISQLVLKTLDKPKRLLDIRRDLSNEGISVSYMRLRKILQDLVREGYVVKFKSGKSIMYARRIN